MRCSFSGLHSLRGEGAIFSITHDPSRNKLLLPVYGTLALLLCYTSNCRRLFVSALFFSRVAKSFIANKKAGAQIFRHRPFGFPDFNEDRERILIKFHKFINLA